jgi:NAD(P)-dependent dehydrogenase (short-subunit alcohol dehydrogenase family)
MAAEGAQVWATDVNPRLLDSYDGVANVHAVPLDVLDKAAITRVVGDLPALDVLFNCAGLCTTAASCRPRTTIGVSPSTSTCARSSG